MVLRLKGMEVAYGLVSSVYIREEQSDTINNKTLFGCPYWCYTTAGIKGILTKKRPTQLVKSLSTCTSYSLGSMMFSSLLLCNIPKLTKGIYFYYIITGTLLLNLAR